MNRRKFLKIAGFGGAATLLGSYPLFIEPNIVQVNTYRIPVPALPKSFHGTRIAHLTDLHLGPFISKAFIESVVKKTNKLKPDIIACTGDYVHGRNSKKQVNAVF